MEASTSADVVEPVRPVLPAYEPRHIRFRELLSIEGWTLKLYGISGHEPAISRALAAATVDIATTALPTAPHTDTRYGVGFVVAHESVTMSYVLVCWWDERNELHQRVFSGPAADLSRLKPHETFAIGACGNWASPTSSGEPGLRTFSSQRGLSRASTYGDSGTTGSP